MSQSGISIKESWIGTPSHIDHLRPSLVDLAVEQVPSPGTIDLRRAAMLLKKVGHALHLALIPQIAEPGHFALSKPRPAQEIAPTASKGEGWVLPLERGSKGSVGSPSDGRKSLAEAGHVPLGITMAASLTDLSASYPWVPG